MGGNTFTRCTQISIHAAREGGDSPKKNDPKEVALFQSTPPVKAATMDALGEVLDGVISIHAAREGGDGGNV